MKRLICMMFVFLVLWGTCGAGEVLEDQAATMELDELEMAVEEYLGQVDLTEGVDLDEGLSRLFERGEREFSGILRRGVRAGVLLLVILLLCALMEGMEQGNSGLSVVTLVGAVAVTAVALADVHALVGMGKEAIGRMETLSKVLLPTMTVACAAAGSPAKAAARQAATMLFADGLLTVIHRLLLPLVYAYVAASAVNAALGSDAVKRMAEFIKWAVTTVLTTLLLAFVGYLSLSGVIAGNTDAMALKTAKFALSGMVPVVGGILSDAAETVLAGAGILKNTVGVAGTLALLSICLLPFLRLGVHYLVYKITAMLGAVMAESKLTKLVSAISGAFGLVMGMTGSCALLLLISIISAVSAVVR